MNIPPLPRRASDSRKGDNGRVLVVGGSERMHGAPILCGLGAQAAGADVIYMVVPKCHAALARGFGLNFQVTPAQKNYLVEQDTGILLEYAPISDVLVMGCGVGTKSTTQKLITFYVRYTEIKKVLDAQALFPEILQGTSGGRDCPHTA